MSLADAADEDYCYVTTTGRVTGSPHTIEIWFGLSANTLYILSGGGEASDWVKNGRKTRDISVRLADVTYHGQLRIVTEAEEDALARRLLLEKYAPPRYNGDLSSWGRTALPVAIDVKV